MIIKGSIFRLLSYMQLDTVSSAHFEKVQGESRKFSGRCSKRLERCRYRKGFT